MANQLRDNNTKRACLWALAGHILSTPPYSSIHPIPLSIDNKLPCVELAFGCSDADEDGFLCHVDSCAGMNTSSLLLHQ